MTRSIVVIGTNGAGKSTFTDYISKRLGYEPVTTGHIIDVYARRVGIIGRRQRLNHSQRTELGFRLRSRFGRYVMGRLILRSLEPDTNYVLEGIRDQYSLEVLRSGFSGQLVSVGIRARRCVRYKRLVKRGDHRQNSFDQRERIDTGYGVQGLIKTCDHIIKNNGNSIENFYTQIDRVLEGIFK